MQVQSYPDLRSAQGLTISDGSGGSALPLVPAGRVAAKAINASQFMMQLDAAKPGAHRSAAVCAGVRSYAVTNSRATSSGKVCDLCPASPKEVLNIVVVRYVDTYTSQLSAMSACAGTGSESKRVRAPSGTSSCWVPGNRTENTSRKRHAPDHKSVVSFRWLPSKPQPSRHIRPATLTQPPTPEQPSDVARSYPRAPPRRATAVPRQPSP